MLKTIILGLFAFFAPPYLEAQEENFPAAPQEVLFDAQYDIYWRGWLCGSMQATLHELEPGNYHYRQHLISRLFFYPFEQVEQSFFEIKEGVIHSQQYHIDRRGLDGPSYKIVFGDSSVLLTEEDGRSEEIKLHDGTHYYDRLVMQLVLIRTLLQNPKIMSLSVDYPDIKGLQSRCYHFDKIEKGYRLFSEHKTKASAFILSAENEYFPCSFQQYRNDKLIFEGEMFELTLGPKWQTLQKEVPEQPKAKEALILWDWFEEILAQDVAIT